MKNRRHERILKLINEHSIETQEELLKYLRSSGFDVTQATVSRDIKELRLLKTMTHDGRYKYTAGVSNIVDIKNNFQSLFGNSVTSVDYAGNLVVIKTSTGMAQAVCVGFDTMKFDSILGSIAGDDTIFVACRSNEAAQSLAGELKKYNG